jgi:esterase/lipase superfamily enzyme
MKELSRWRSPRLERDVTVARWGHYGVPVLLFPTAGGDAEEVERMHLVSALQPLIEAGRIKVYSCDSVAGQAWISKKHPVAYCSTLQNRFDAFVYREVVPAIRADCDSTDIEIVSLGASIGAFNAVATLCRHPDVFRVAIGMSGTYDLEKLLDFSGDENFFFASPLLFVPGLDQGPDLDALRRRFVLLAAGQGRAESPEESWRMANALGARGVPNRVDEWGPDYHHDWPTWREMAPRYLAEFAP